VGSFELVWAEDEFSPNLGELQEAPGETERGGLPPVRFQLQEMPAGWRGARRAITPAFPASQVDFYPRWVSPGVERSGAGQRAGESGSPQTSSGPARYCTGDRDLPGAPVLPPGE